MLTCTILPHFRPAAIAAALLPLPPPPLPPKATLVVGAPFSSGSFLSEDSLPNPMKPWDVSPSLALCPANFAKRANLKKGLFFKKKGKRKKNITSKHTSGMAGFWVDSVVQWCARALLVLSHLKLYPKLSWDHLVSFMYAPAHNRRTEIMSFCTYFNQWHDSFSILTPAVYVIGWKVCRETNIYSLPCSST